MKEKYTKPTVDVEEFHTVDVVTTSSTQTDDNDVEWPF